MKPIAEKAKTLPRSGIRVLMELAQAQPDAIHLEIGQPGFPTPAHIVEAAHQAALAGFTRYTDNAGFYSLREKIARQITKQSGVPTGVENIVVTSGSMLALKSVLAALLEPSDEVLIPDPGYPNYSMMTLMTGGKVIRYSLEPEAGFRPDLTSLEQCVTPRTKVIIVNSPSNPTGTVLLPEEIRELVAFAGRHDLYLLSDEAYDKIIFEGRHVSPRQYDQDGRVLACYSFSKTYAMTGWRVGYAVAEVGLAQILTKLQEVFVACASSVSQKAAEAAIDGPQTIVQEMVDAYRRNRDSAVEILHEAGLPVVLPQGAFYLMVPIISAGLDSFVFARQLLDETGVVVAPGETFGPGGSQYIRVSLAASNENLVLGLDRLMHFLHTRRCR